MTAQIMLINIKYNDDDDNDRFNFCNDNHFEIQPQMVWSYPPTKFILTIDIEDEAVYSKWIINNLNGIVFYHFTKQQDNDIDEKANEIIKKIIDPNNPHNKYKSYKAKMWPFKNKKRLEQLKEEYEQYKPTLNKLRQDFANIPNSKMPKIDIYFQSNEDMVAAKLIK